MNDFEFYYNCFGNLNTAKMKGLAAPHKPLLLLSVLDLIETGIIKTNIIDLSDVLINRFKENTKIYIGTSTIFTPNIGYPYFHLSSEPFWKLIHKLDSGNITNEGNFGNSKVPRSAAAESKEIYKPSAFEKPTYSIKGLRDRYIGAMIDKELFNLLQNQDVRAKYRTLLISRYLSNQPNSISKDSLLLITGIFLNLYQVVG